MSIAEKIMEAIAEDVQGMMCRDCPHAEHSEGTFYDPEWNDCPGEGEPWDGGCRRHEEYEAIEERVKECERDIKVVIFGRVCVRCPGK